METTRPLKKTKWKGQVFQIQLQFNPDSPYQHISKECITIFGWFDLFSNKFLFVICFGNNIKINTFLILSSCIRKCLNNDDRLKYVLSACLEKDTKKLNSLQAKLIEILDNEGMIKVIRIRIRLRCIGAYGNVFHS